MKKFTCMFLCIVLVTLLHVAASGDVSFDVSSLNQKNENGEDSTKPGDVNPPDPTESTTTSTTTATTPTTASTTTSTTTTTTPTTTSTTTSTTTATTPPKETTNATTTTTESTTTSTTTATTPTISTTTSTTTATTPTTTSTSTSTTTATTPPKETTNATTTTTESTTTSTTTEGTTPVETTPGDTTPGDTTPGDTTPGDTTPGDTTPGDTTPGDTTPGDTTPGDTTPGDTTPGDTTPGNTTPGDTTPGDTTPEPTGEPTTTLSPIDENYDYVVKNKETGKTCVAVKMAIALNIRYTTNNNEEKTHTLKVPENAEVSGECAATNATMILTWREAVTTRASDSNTVEVTFQKKDSTTSIDQLRAFIYLDQKNFPDAKDTELEVKTDAGLELFAASTGNSRYVCNEEEKVQAKSVDFRITDVQLVAYPEDDNVQSLPEENCAYVEEAGVNVGAIVGGVIGGVVVIGIIAFIIWKKKKNSRSVKEP